MLAEEFTPKYLYYFVNAPQTLKTYIVHCVKWSVSAWVKTLPFYPVLVSARVHAAPSLSCVPCKKSAPTSAMGGKEVQHIKLTNVRTSQPYVERFSQLFLFFTAGS